MAKDYSSDIPPKPRATTRGKLIVLLFVVLIISSGTLYYRDSPIPYYAFLGLSVLLVIVIIYIVIHISKGTPRLFSEYPEGDMEQGVRSTENAGLEKVLKAEKRYKDKLKKLDKKSSARAKHKVAKGEKSSGKTIHTGKRRKIGSIPMEESIFKERVTLKNKSGLKKKPEKSSKVTTFLCPSCGSKELYYEAGLISGYKYHCKDCDYIGSFVIEKDFKIDNPK
jgi:predicted RNA-binding Zn-ribbon protein involved in translation (DUF1610 family)